MNRENAYTRNYSEGAKYQACKDLTDKEIAKLIREEIRKKYPTRNGYKISVTIRHFGALGIYIKETPKPIYNKKYAELAVANRWEELREYTECNWREKEYSEFGLKLLDDLKRIGEQYNFDDSDAMIDYFHVNYYLSVETHWEFNDSLLKASLLN